MFYVDDNSVAVRGMLSKTVLGKLRSVSEHMSNTLTDRLTSKRILIVDLPPKMVGILMVFHSWNRMRTKNAKHLKSRGRFLSAVTKYMFISPQT